MWVPLKQTVIISPFIGDDPDWGTPNYGTDYEAKCRFSEGVKMVRNHRGEEVVSTGVFIFDRLPELSINDRLTYTDEHGRETEYTPLSLAVKRWINGKPVITEVYV